MLRTTTLAYNIKTLGWHGPMDNPRSHPLPRITSHVEHKKYQQTSDISMTKSGGFILIHIWRRLETSAFFGTFAPRLHDVISSGPRQSSHRVLRFKCCNVIFIVQSLKYRFKLSPNMMPNMPKPAPKLGIFHPRCTNDDKSLLTVQV